eukprot:Gb_38695 [translate_table: standard]
MPLCIGNGDPSCGELLFIHRRKQGEFSPSFLQQFVVHKRKPLQDITHLFCAIDNARRSSSVLGRRPFVELGAFNCSQNCNKKRKTAHASTNAQQRHERPALRKGFR